VATDFGFRFTAQLKYRYYYEILDDTTKAENTFMTSWWTEHNNGEHGACVQLFLLSLVGCLSSFPLFA
jgi:hypothetical protein